MSLCRKCEPGERDILVLKGFQFVEQINGTSGRETEALIFIYLFVTILLALSWINKTTVINWKEKRNDYFEHVFADESLRFHNEKHTIFLYSFQKENFVLLKFKPSVFEKDVPTATHWHGTELNNLNLNRKWGKVAFQRSMATFV